MIKMHTVLTKTPPPAIYSTPLVPWTSTWAAAIGAMMEKILPQKLAMPQAVPLTGAGKASGVQPYSIPLNMDWKK